MKINRKFTPFSIEIESKEEQEFLKAITFEYTQKRNSILLGKYYNDPNLEKAKYLLSILEYVW